MVRAYVLIKLEGGSDTQRLEHVKEHPQIESMSLVLGSWDIVLECHAETLEGLGDLAKQIRSCPGVAESETFPVVG